MREKYMLALANLVNGSELGYEDRSSIPQYKKDIEDYVDSLEEQNKRYKEVIDKAIEYIEKHKRKDEFLELNEWGTRDLLDIIKEVE